MEDNQFLLHIIKKNHQYAEHQHPTVQTIMQTPQAGLDLSLLVAPREASLLAKLAEYPESLERALDELGPHQVAFYLRELAGEMHSYYNAERVLVEDEALKMARVALLLATRQVLRNGLGLIGVTAPDKM